jgi:hypothetical protein
MKILYVGLVEKQKFSVVKQYWEDSNKCSFKHCNFDRHDSLNIEEEHIKYYMTKVLNWGFVTDIQGKIIEALFSVWKLILFDRLCRKIGWKPQIPFNILMPKWEYEIVDDVTDEKIKEVAIPKQSSLGVYEEDEKERVGELRMKK